MSHFYYSLPYSIYPGKYNLPGKPSVASKWIAINSIEKNTNAFAIVLQSPKATYREMIT